MELPQNCTIVQTEDGVAVITKPCRRCGDDQGAASYIDHLVNDRGYTITKHGDYMTHLRIYDA